MLRRLLESGLVVSLLIGAASADAAMHATGEFEAGATRPRSIVFLPPQATLIKQKVVQAEQQADASGELAGYLGASVEAAFKAQGYDVRVLTPAEIGKDPELEELVLDASRGYAEMLTQLRLKLPRQIGKQPQRGRRRDAARWLRSSASTPSASPRSRFPRLPPGRPSSPVSRVSARPGRAR